MGDASPLVYYQDSHCAASVYAASPTYLQVASSSPLSTVTYHANNG